MMLYSRNTSVEITPDLLRALELRHPKKAVSDELLKMGLWLTRYPKRRPVNIWRFVDNWLGKSPDVRQPAPVHHAWWTTVDRTINQGLSLGMQPRPGESMDDYRSRISERLRAA